MATPDSFTHHASLRNTGKLRARGLYAITDGRRDGLIEAVRAALEGGAVIVQYRDKTRDATRRLQEARALVALCRGHGVPMLVNDDVELARESGATGVHVGEDDADVAAAREALGPHAIIGASCYDSVQRARTAAAAGADYVAFGSFFPTTSKVVTRFTPMHVLQEARALGLPVVAIGGITPDNGARLVAAGADFLAVISGVFGATDIRAATRAYAELFDTDRSG